MTYDAADSKAVELVNAGRHRIVFVTEDITVAHEMRYDYAVMNYGIIGMIPVKRYMRDSRGYISVKAVKNWRRN
jgi:hypothetical protein